MDPEFSICHYLTTEKYHRDFETYTETTYLLLCPNCKYEWTENHLTVYRKHNSYYHRTTGICG